MSSTRVPHTPPSDPVLYERSCLDSSQLTGGRSPRSAAEPHVPISVTNYSCRSRLKVLPLWTAAVRVRMHCCAHVCMPRMAAADTRQCFAPLQARWHGGYVLSTWGKYISTCARGSVLKPLVDQPALLLAAPWGCAILSRLAAFLNYVGVATSGQPLRCLDVAGNYARGECI